MRACILRLERLQLPEVFGLAKRIFVFLPVMSPFPELVIILLIASLDVWLPEKYILNHYDLI